MKTMVVRAGVASGVLGGIDFEASFAVGLRGLQGGEPDGQPHLQAVWDAAGQR